MDRNVRVHTTSTGCLGCEALHARVAALEAAIIRQHRTHTTDITIEECANPLCALVREAGP